MSLLKSLKLYIYILKPASYFNYIHELPLEAKYILIFSTYKGCFKNPRSIAKNIRKSKTYLIKNVLKMSFYIIINGAKLASRSPVPTGRGEEFCGIKCTNIKTLYTILSGRGKKTTSAMALMDWSVWRHWIYH